MKKKEFYLIVFCVFILNNFAFSQKVFDIKADLISITPYTIDFYKKSSDKNYRELDFEIQELYDFEYNFNLASFTTRDSLYIFKSNSSITNIENLPNLDLESFKKQLNKKYFLKKNGQEITQLEYFNNSYFVLNNYEYREVYNYDKDKRENQWILNYSTFYNYIFLRINKQKPIVLLYENHFRGDLDHIGHIIPFNETYKIAIDGQEFINTDSNIIDKEWLIKTKNNYLYEDADQILYRIEENKLKDLVFNIDLLSKKFDTLYLEKGYVIGKTKGNYQIYNSKLENITPKKKVTAVHIFNNEFLQTIVSDKVIWLNKSGEISYKKPNIINIVCGTVAYSKREIRNENNSFVLIDNTNNLFVGGDNNTTSYNLFPNTEYDDVLFLNGTKTLSFDGNTGTGSYFKLPNNSLNYLIVKKDGKFGLLEIVFLDNGIKLNTILPVKYDSIISSGYYLPIKFESNGLFGYYPINTNAKYKKVEKFNFYFSKFVLPNNKKGWLSLDGKEYID
ncbi:hypothetical protein [Salinimicrobium gaetbulicola]|uniref:WG repeat protein n=1 Tax=Salinimicrobium gaetbulicola TaxID=999702 RepID=A0ABW3IAL4_9FLAO